nr:cytosolic sulfotransferase 5-like [Ipomoea batatas]GME20871.1 cytosolic sulfotransferase 5-like [Ipomoea batatas]
MFSGTQQAIVEFNPRPTDIILASFPKTGTTWLKSLLYSIINPSSLDSLVNNSPHDLVPCLELDVYGESSKPNILSSSDDTRIFQTHIPYQLLGKIIESSGCRVVYVTRNPKDTLNSLWHFVNKSKVDEDAPWELEEAVEKFCPGVVPCGPYYEHVLGPTALWKLCNGVVEAFLTILAGEISGALNQPVQRIRSAEILHSRRVRALQHRRLVRQSGQQISGFLHECLGILRVFPVGHVELIRAVYLPKEIILRVLELTIIVPKYGK